MTNIEGSHFEAQATDILRQALRLESRGYTHPAVLRGRLGAIALVWVAGLGALVASFTALVRSSTANEQHQLMYSYLLLLSAATFIAATIGMFLVLWNAYVHQYILAVQAREEAVVYMWEGVGEAALNLAGNADFRKQLLAEVVSSNRVSELGMANVNVLVEETVKQLAEKAKAASGNV